MKKVPAFLLTVAFALLLTACGKAEQSPSSVVENSRLESPTEQAGTSSPTDRTDTDNIEEDAKKETGEMTTIQIIINGQEFEAELYDNEAAHQFREMLPLQLDMEDLHNNEKYFYFSDAFNIEDQEVKEMQEGDFMIYDSRCLVLFYENFETDYKYTPLGKISNTAGLKETLGTGTVSVSFQIGNTSETVQDFVNDNSFNFETKTVTLNSARHKKHNF